MTRVTPRSERLTTASTRSTRAPSAAEALAGSATQPSSTWNDQADARPPRPETTPARTRSACTAPDRREKPSPSGGRPVNTRPSRQRAVHVVPSQNRLRSRTEGSGYHPGRAADPEAGRAGAAAPGANPPCGGRSPVRRITESVQAVPSHRRHSAASSGSAYQPAGAPVVRFSPVLMRRVCRVALGRARGSAQAVAGRTDAGRAPARSALAGRPPWPGTRANPGRGRR